MTEVFEVDGVWLRLVPAAISGASRTTDGYEEEESLWRASSRGIMSARFGTPTSGCGSGTEKECNDALKRWRAAAAPWITFYFDARPRMSGDPKQAEQYLKVCEFRRKVERAGLHATYTGVRGSSESFYEKVSEHLCGIVRQMSA
jgi:hypothetical protein